LINQYPFAAGEFATDQGASGRCADDGGRQSDSFSPTIIARFIRWRSGDCDRNSAEQADAEAEALIKLLFLRIGTQRSPDLPYIVAFELHGLLIFD
jgi:hypothetical protein